MTTILYARTSTDHQDNGIEGQVEALLTWAGTHGFDGAELVVEKLSARTTRLRPLMMGAMDRLDKEGGALVVTKLDRLSRSLQDFGDILRRAVRRHNGKKQWGIKVLDMGGGEALDTETTGGFMMANLVMLFAEWERRTTSDRITATMARLKASGMKLGKPSAVPASTRRRIARLRATGMTWQAVADKLNADGVPTPAALQIAAGRKIPHGAGKWDITKVRRHCSAPSPSGRGVARSGGA